jgi:hypothetical protein
MPNTESKLKKIERYIGNTWKINATIFNVASEKAGYFGNIGDNPFEFGRAVIKSFGLASGKKAPEMYVSSHIFFSKIATALNELRDRIYVEIRLGDATAFLEDTRIGLLKDRESTWPSQYDHVHLSNVP